MESDVLGGHSMSDPGTTYRTREEIQHMRSSNDAIQGLKSKLLEWGVVSENELKEIDKKARKKVDDEVSEAEKSPERADPLPSSPPPSSHTISLLGAWS